MTKNVLFIAPCLTTSGYGVHSRQIAKYLINKHNSGKINLAIKPVPWGTTPWLLDANMLDGFVGQIMDLTNGPSKQPDLTIQNILPNEWRPVGKQNIGITAGVETNICNPQWLDCINAMSHVIVPSEFTKNVFLKTSQQLSKELTTEINVVPESYNEFIPTTKNKLTLELGTNFNFLIFGQLTAKSVLADRKNTFNTVKWLCEAFKDDKDVGIIIKTNSGRQTKIDKLITRRVIDQLLKEVRKSEFPKVHLVHGPMSDEHVAMLYKEKTIKALVTATRGEGYGLPILEAAASGLPVIATNWSGHLDFMKLGKFIKLDYDLKNVTKQRVDNKIFMENSKWAEVKEDDFKKKVIKFKKSSSIPKQWANELSAKLIDKLSIDEVSKKYDEILGKFL